MSLYRTNPALCSLLSLVIPIFKIVKSLPKRQKLIQVQQELFQSLPKLTLLIIKNLLFGLTTEKFEKGFHLVKGRNQAKWNRNESLITSFENELQYFDNTSPWKDLSDRSCFGTKNLRVKIGELYVELIRASLPDTVQDFKERKEMALTKLEHLSVLYNTPTEKRQFVNEVIDEVRKHVSFYVCDNAVNVEHTGIVQFYDACDIFKAKINQGQLANILAVEVGMEVFVKEVRCKVGWKDNSKGEVYLVNFDFAEVKRPEFLGYQVMNYQLTLPVGCVGMTSNNEIVVSHGIKTNIYSTLKPFSLNSLKRVESSTNSIITNRRTFGLPICTDPVIFSAIVSKRFEEDWKQPCCDLIDAAKRLLEDSLFHFLKKATMIHKYPKYRDYIKSVFYNVGRESAMKMKQEIDTYFSKEQKIPYTQDAFVFETIKKKRVEKVLNEIVASLSLDKPINTSDVLNKATVKEVADTVAAKIMSQSVTEFMAEEMENILDCYGTVVSKRCIDQVPTICIHHITEFSTRITNELLTISENDLNSLIVHTVNSQAQRQQIQTYVQELEADLAVFASLLTTTD